ncbi:putative FAD-dependent oxido-reductase [Oenococcus oeni]|uniref:FAD-binding oxidoreductase n=1 Tax=Oenococcus oeni TaxID=1247 RepID=UPI0010B3AC61|nr:FAD-dependent oxidoreductase [Oenococcus oeni]SYV98996.1 putative FAD-dependent oxido-reductase [Oenococcus oeni]
MKRIAIKNWPKLPNDLIPIAIDRNSVDYVQASSNCFITGKPKLILMARTENEAAASIKYASRVRKETGIDVPFSFRSGGHGISMASVNNDGIILDISKLKKVEIVDINKGLVKVQAGAVWGDVAEFLNRFHLVISSGDFGDTGVGGLSTSGGVGLLVRSFGLTIDHILAAKVITADGEIRSVDKDNEPDLFWAIRGGSSQIGLVTELLFQADKIEPGNQYQCPITVQNIDFIIDDLESFVRKWGKWIDEAPLKITSNLMFTSFDNNQILVKMNNFWVGMPNQIANDAFKKASKLAIVKKYDQKVVDYGKLVKAPHNPHKGQQPVYVKNVLLNNFIPHLGTKISDIVHNQKTIGVELRSIGGYLNTVDANQTAWADRSAVIFIAFWSKSKNNKNINRIFDSLQKVDVGVYGAYSSDLSMKESYRIWPSETAQKLKNIMSIYDHKHLFNQGHYLYD